MMKIINTERPQTTLNIPRDKKLFIVEHLPKGKSLSEFMVEAALEKLKKLKKTYPQV